MDETTGATPAAATATVSATAAASVRTSLCVLGSSSSGNCSVLVVERAEKPRALTLIDLGLSPRETGRRLAAVGLCLHDVQGAIVTHFDGDHFNTGWIKAGRRLGFTLRFSRHHRGWANRSGATRLRCDCFTGEFALGEDGEVVAQPIHLQHDEWGSVGFRIRTPAGAIGYATDLGCVTDDLLDLFQDLRLLAIESNYCPKMQEASGRPHYLKRRIMGGWGHLSNEESFQAVRILAEQSPALEHVALLHLSRQCNRPQRVREIYETAPDLARRVTISAPDAPTSWLHCDGMPQANGSSNGRRASDRRMRARAALETGGGLAPGLHLWSELPAAAESATERAPNLPAAVRKTG